LWCGETHQYLNISTHPLRLNTPKEKEAKIKGMTAKKINNNHPLELNVPKSDQPKHPKIPKEETSLKQINIQEYELMV
jgi:hypothetical protein